MDQTHMSRYRFHYLLATLFTLILTLPLVPRLGAWSRHVSFTLFVLLLLTAAYAVSQRRFARVITLWLCGITIVIEAVSLWRPSETVQIAGITVSALFIGCVIAIIIRNLFHTAHVTANTICAALSAYLLMAVLWACLYALVDGFDPGAFAINSGIGGQMASMSHGSGRSVIAIYFSIVTITTLGYGDIVPVSSTAAMLATAEAVIGQFYLTVLVAWLVGMYISDSLRHGSR